MGQQRRARFAAAKGRMPAASLVVLLACSMLTGPAAAAAASAPGGRKLKQVTLFYDTPAAAGSTTVDAKAHTAVAPDGTFKLGAGLSTSSTDAFSNPLPYYFTDGAYKNRPQVASTAYTQIPLLLQQTVYPTLSYGLAEGRGDALSTSNGGWGNMEFGYNPLSNNLGLSTSSGTSNSVNVASGEDQGSVNPKSGFSGIEFAGFSNDLTNLADARTDQSGQALAYPYNILSPYNPLTCTQSLLYAATLTGYDLGAPVAPLPRENPPSVVPYCLSLFNFGVLDDFVNFVDNNSDYEAFFDNNGDGKIDGLRDYFKNGVVFNTTGKAKNPSAKNTTNISEIKADPFASKGVIRQSNNKGGNSSSGKRKKKNATPNFSTALKKAVARSPELKLMASTPLGSELLLRLSDSALSTAYDGTADLLSNITANAVRNLAEPIAKFTGSATNFTSGVLFNATNVGVKAAVAGLEATEPLLRVAKGVNDRLIQPVAKASSETAAKLAQRSADLIQQRLDAMPDGQGKSQLEAALGMSAPGSAQNAGAAGSQAGAMQMGKRRMLH